MTLTPAQKWESRYREDQYVYGTDPNDFLVESVADLPPGRALCLADGEGRNSVYLATLGHTVTAIDLTEAGMAKAAKLAETRGVELTTVVADLADYDFGVDRWDLIVSIFAHTAPPVRTRVHASMATALAADGRFILEAYTPDQIGRGTGGPMVPEMTMTLEGLTEELREMEVISGRETIRPINEGSLHNGDGAVVQIVAQPQKPLGS